MLFHPELTYAIIPGLKAHLPTEIEAPSLSELSRLLLIQVQNFCINNTDPYHRWYRLSSHLTLEHLTDQRHIAPCGDSYQGPSSSAPVQGGVLSAYSAGEVLSLGSHAQGSPAVVSIG